MNRRRPLLLSTVVFFIALVIGRILIYNFERHRTSEQRSALNEIADGRASALQRQIDRSFASTFALAAALRQGKGKIDNFDSIAADIAQSYGAIGSLQLAPDGVVKQVYPLAGNEKVLGHDLLKDSRRRTSALSALEARKLTLAGPYELIQGGVGVIGRLPVFLPDETGKERFWGFAIATIPIIELLQASDIERLAQQGYNYQLWHVDVDSGKRVVFAQSKQELIENTVEFGIEVPNDKWILSIAPTESSESLGLLATEVFLVVLISLMIAFICYIVLQEPIKLAFEVKKSTQKLALANEKLRAEILERQEVEATLRESEERLQAILDNTIANVYLKDLEGRLILVNRQCEILFQRTKDQLLGKKNYEILPVETADAMSANDRHVLETGTPIEIEESIIQNDGIHTYISVKFPLKDSAGVVYAVGGISTDITERKQAEEALENIVAGTARVTAEEFFPPLVRHLATALGVRYAVVTQAADNQLKKLKTLAVWAGDRLVENFEYELAGTPCGVVVNSAEMCLYPDRLQELFSQSKLLVSMDAVGYLGVPLLDASQNVIGNLCIFDDKPILKEKLAKCIMSIFAARAAAELERLRSHEQIRRLNAELEERVIQRTAQMEAANKELEAFCYSVSHDLKTPLRHIDGFSYLLLEDCGELLNNEGKDYIERIRGASQRMIQLIEDLLNLSRQTRGNMHRENIDLSAIASEIATWLQQHEPHRQVEFIIADKVFACGDKRLLRVVLQNLLENAWKYTAKHPTARIEFGIVDRQSERGTGDTILATQSPLPTSPIYFVRDDGAGFDMAYSYKLFAAFQRLHASTEFPGNGIGLVTVQRIINRHGGRIWAEAEVEKGATFYFTL